MSGALEHCEVRRARSSNSRTFFAGPAAPLSVLVVDMAQTAMIDGTGNGLLIELRNILERKSGVMKGTNVSPDIIQLFRRVRPRSRFKASPAPES